MFYCECGYTTSTQLVKKILNLRGCVWNIKNYQMSPVELKKMVDNIESLKSADYLCAEKWVTIEGDKNEDGLLGITSICKSIIAQVRA